MGYVDQRVEELLEMGQRPQGRPRKRWFEMLKEDMKKVGVSLEDTLDKNIWKHRTRAANPK